MPEQVINRGGRCAAASVPYNDCMAKILDQDEKLLPQGKPEPAGPFVGTIIVVLLLAFGALYFWGVHLNKRTRLQAEQAAAAAAAAAFDAQFSDAASGTEQ